MWFLLILRLCISLLLGYIIARRGLKRGSLSSSGATCAFIVGSVILFTNLALGLSLIVFYISGSALTRYKENFKMTIDLDAKKGGGQRTMNQVLCTAGIPTLACLGLLVSPVITSPPSDISLCPSYKEELGLKNILLGLFLGSLSCVAGDTFASELGILSSTEPVLITTSERVPRGTSGGVTLYGFLVSALGGLLVGFIMALDVIGIRWNLLLLNISMCENETLLYSFFFYPFLGACMGLLGSIIDSILGATLQRTWFDTKIGKVTAEFPKDGIESMEPYAPELLDTLKERDALRAELKSLREAQREKERQEITNGLRQRKAVVETQEEIEDDNETNTRTLVTIGGLAILSNEQVNLVSALFSALVSATIFYRLFSK
jgi:uncharacterized membrane protein